MREKYAHIMQSHTHINARQFQQEGTNQGISLLVSMVAQKMNSNPEQGGDTSRINGTALQCHSVPNLVRALKDNNKLQQLHYEISTSYYPPIDE